MNRHRTWTEYADRATKVALKAPELRGLLDDLAFDIAHRLRAVGGGDEVAWACADAAHRAMAAVLIVREGRVFDTLKRLTIVNRALDQLPAVLRQWLPGGEKRGFSFSGTTPSGSGTVTINMLSGAWTNPALGAAGDNPIDLAAHLFGISEAEAERRILDMLRERA